MLYVKIEAFLVQIFKDRRPKIDRLHQSLRFYLTVVEG